MRVLKPSIRALVRGPLVWAVSACLALLVAPASRADTALYWSEGAFQPGELFWAPLANPSGSRRIASGADAISVVAVDAGAGQLYWTGSSVIRRATLAGSDAEVVESTGGFSEGLALDPGNQHVYWTNWSGEIRRIDFDRQGEVLLRSEGQQLFGLALDLVRGRMYWAADDRGIYRANLDGSDRQLIAQAGHEPLGVAVDPAGAKVYWADWDGGILQRTDLDGLTPPETIYTCAGCNPIGVHVDPVGGKLYWSEWGTRDLRRANLDGSDLELLTTASQQPWGLALGPVPPPPLVPLVQLTHNTTTDTSPDIDAGRVVWSGDGPAGTREIFLWDGSGVSQVTPDGIHERVPRVSGANLAWISDIDSDGEVFFFDGTTPEQVTDDATNHSGFSLDGQRVAWADWDGLDGEIAVWEGGVTTHLTDNTRNDGSPSISGPNAIWTRVYSGGSDTEIVFWDGSSETRLTDNAGSDDVPILDGTNATWMSFEDGDWHIYFWDGTGPPVRIESPATDERFPDISGRRIVWAGRDGSATDDHEIYVWDDGEILQLTDNDVLDFEPAISGRDIVWISHVDGDPEVFLATLPPPVPALPGWALLPIAAGLVIAARFGARTRAQARRPSGAVAG